MQENERARNWLFEEINEGKFAAAVFNAGQIQTSDWKKFF